MTEARARAFLEAAGVPFDCLRPARHPWGEWEVVLPLDAEAAIDALIAAGCDNVNVALGRYMRYLPQHFEPPVTMHFMLPGQIDWRGLRWKPTEMRDWPADVVSDLFRQENRQRTHARQFTDTRVGLRFPAALHPAE